MPDRPGAMLWDGVNDGGFLSGEGTRSHGMSPSIATMEILPQLDPPAEAGDLIFEYGDVQVVWKDCCVDYAAFRAGQEGQTWTLPILDRRWKWAFAGPKGALSGSYNFKLDDGTFDPAQLATPQALCILCLEAMGEVGYDVSQVPNDMLGIPNWPEVNWDYEIPAVALSGLCDQLGCHIVLRLDNTVLIARMGTGANLPTDNVEFDSFTLKPLARPDALQVITGKYRVQADFVLNVPLGLDTDGKVRPIDSLSYKPKNGWASEVSPDFPNVKAQFGLQAWELAKATVWRWYGIADQNPDKTAGFVLPGFGRVTLIPDQILPLEDVQVETAQNIVAGVPISKPAIVWGVWFDGSTSFNNVTKEKKWWDVDKNSLYAAGYEIDKALGIVKFADYVYRFEQKGLDANPQVFTKLPADLNLRCACSPRFYDTWSYKRGERTLVYDGPQSGTGPRILKHDEIVTTVYPVYDPNTYKVQKVVTNFDQVNQECDFYLNAANLEYQTPTPQDVQYMGLIPIDLDGAIQQVTWRIDGQGVTTRASRNQEYRLVTPSYQVRRNAEQLLHNLLGNTIRQVQGLVQKDQREGK